MPGPVLWRQLCGRRRGRGGAAGGRCARGGLRKVLGADERRARSPSTAAQCGQCGLGVQRVSCLSSSRIGMGCQCHGWARGCHRPVCVGHCVPSRGQRACGARRSASSLGSFCGLLSLSLLFCRATCAAPSHPLCHLGPGGGHPEG